MAVRFISGKPGGGKSYYATVLVLERLRETKKQIVTNLPLRVDEICAYLHAEYDQTFDAAERIRILTPEQTSEFWVYFGQGLDLDTSARIEIVAAGGRKVQHLDYAPRYKWADAHPNTNAGAVCYFIDEAHEFFNAREWKDLGKDCLHYLSQHRKLGDEVTFITQHVRNVDTQLRRICAEFCYARNHLKEKLPGLAGIFRSIPRMGIAFYNQEESPSAVQVDHRFLRPSWGTIGKCYDTAAGVGIGGRKADIGERAKGIPIWGVFVALALVGVGFNYLTSTSLWGKFLGGGGSAVSSLVPSVPVAQARAVPASPHVGEVKTVEVVQSARSEAKEERRLTGVSTVGGIARAFWSDGDIRMHTDRGWGGLIRRGGRVAGVLFDGREWIIAAE